MTDPNATPGAKPGDATANPAVVEQDEETEGQTAQGENQDESAGDAGEGDESKDKKPELTPEQKQIHSLQRRIGRLTSDKVNHKAEITALQRQIDELKTGTTKPDDDGKPQLTEEEVERRARTLAAQGVRQLEHAKTVNAALEKGQKAYKDFDSMVRVVNEEVGGFYDGEDGPPRPITIAIFEETDKPHLIIKHLSENPDIAAEIAKLPPQRQISRIVRLESELGKQATPPKPSGAPKPIVPVQGGATAVVEEAKLSDKEWWERRKKARLGT